MWYQIKSYFQFLLRSTNQHGVHSPFVYQLVCNCFYDTKKYPAYKSIKQYRKSLESNHNTISVTDFGAGSRVFKSNKRKISSIAKNAGIPLKKQFLLYRLCTYFKTNTVLELGTSLGFGSLAMALANSKSLITTIEGCPNTAAVAKQSFTNFKIENIKLLQKTFESFLEEEPSTYDLIYIDGSHNKKSTLEYFNSLLNYVHNDSILIFDDIYWSIDMTEAWKEIIQNPKVKVSIDTFYWGFVFFRKEQEKEHFSIRL